MLKQTINQKGFIIWHGVLLVAVIAAIGFVGGSVYTAQKNARTTQNKAANVTDTEKVASELKTVKKEVTQPAAETVDVPAEEKKLAPAPAPAPEQKTVKKSPAAQPVKKDHTYVPVTASANVGVDTVVLSATLPAAHTGTCKALVKHMDGSNHQWHEVALNSSNACTLNVPRSGLTSAAEWQYYIFFNSSDWTVKGDTGKKTFTL